MIKTIDAILAINPNAKVKVSEGSERNIEWLENTTPISDADIDAKITELQNSENASKVSGNQKLLDLGLTQAEATALTGYTPSE
tara:strand:- start:1554 stop:1805 length:252 start_codon:yes stop_codon:yes gene_type:complete